MLAKGPVHEGFAATAEAPLAAPVIAKEPPEPIEELPPDQKPEGDNVQWIPGYWHWDEENAQFIWISGFWRQPPPGRVWVPGSWRAAGNGWQWVSGFWQEVDPQLNQQVQPQIEYLPPPPASVEIGPSVAAPDATSFYVPGSWVWRGRYVWRPGVWVGHRPGWVWVPAHFRWTPAGYVFIDGYWDYPLSTRGVLFAPVVFPQAVYARPAFVYTPAYVVSAPAMVGALFVRRGYGNYYFGDYFAPRYAAGGYSAWCGTVGRGGFNVGFGVGRTWGYDPLWSYYSAAYRNTPAWGRGVGTLYGGRYSGDIVRPPATLVQQNTAITNITKVTNVRNVTNNITVVNGAPTVNNRDVSNVAMVAPLAAAPGLQRTKFQAVSADARRSEAASARQLRDVGTQRTRLETAAVNQRPAVASPGQPAAAPAQPRSIKLDVPKAAVTRAQVSDEQKAPPPNPHRGTHNKPTATVDPPRFNPPSKAKVDPPQPTVNPPQKGKVEQPPRVNPQPAPRVDPPKPKVELAPRVNPQPKGKVDPPQPPVNPPQKGKVEQPPRVNPKPKGKVDPPRVNPQPMPRVDPPRVNPQPAPRPVVEVPKVNPSRRPGNPPVTPLPPVGAPGKRPGKVEPPPVSPRVDPPRPPVAVVPPPTRQKGPAFSPPQPRPAVIVPAAQPPRVIQPPKAQPPQAPPRPQPAAPGKSRHKGNRGRAE